MGRAGRHQESRGIGDTLLCCTRGLSGSAVAVCGRLCCGHSAAHVRQRFDSQTAPALLVGWCDLRTCTQQGLMAAKEP